MVSLLSITKDEQTAVAVVVVINGLEAHFVVEIALKINLLGGAAVEREGEEGQSYGQTLSLSMNYRVKSFFSRF